MYRLSECPCCGGKDFISRSALVAPFVAEVALRAAPPLCELLECRACGFRFFADRYDDAEAARLYAGYRGADYFQIRHRHEPWYSRRTNEGLGRDPKAVATRRARIDAQLTRHRPPGSITRVLDYGGDAGQMLPPSLGSVRHVFELSDVAPVEGVQRVASEAELVPGTYDAIVLAHVLEHVSDLPATLSRVTHLLAPEGLIYVEVPFERPRIVGTAGSGFQRAYLDRLRRFPLLLRFVDFVSTASRIGLGVVPPLGFVKMHEHINFFDAKSLAALMRRAGLQVLSTSTETGAVDGAVVSCVGSATPSSVQRPRS
jgi:SAM-dependent methyltransferase